MPRPMRSLLKRVSGRMSLHMPAAQGRAPFRSFPPYRWDTTELPVTDDLYRATGAIAEAEKLAARSAHTSATLMTVLENLEMGAYSRRNKSEMLHDLEMVFGHFPRLKERVKQIAGTLSGGEQQMLATGRALMAHPTLLMMDEPSMVSSLSGMRLLPTERGGFSSRTARKRRSRRGVYRKGALLQARKPIAHPP